MSRIEFSSLEEARQFLKGMPIWISMCLISIGLQYWKPSFWWNSPGVKFYRHLLGDQVIEISTYAGSLLFLLVFSWMGWLTWQELRSNSR